MADFFVNLPLRYVAREPAYLDYFLEHGLCPELGLDALAINALDMDWHEKLARTLAGAGVACSVHLPFFDLQPGSLDDLIVAATQRRLVQAIEIASVYDPSFFIAHAMFNEPLYTHFYDNWLERSISTWREVMKHRRDETPLYLENVFETDPAPLVAVVRELGPETGLCLDMGHWHSFGQGRDRQNLQDWIKDMAPHLSHLHLHDNDGTGDQHLGLGKGTIPWANLFSALASQQLSPTITLEPHTEQDLAASLDFADRHPQWLRPAR